MRKLASLLLVFVFLVSTSACIIKPEIRVITDPEELSDITNINLEDYGIHTNDMNITEINNYVPVVITTDDIKSALSNIGVSRDRYLVTGEDLANNKLSSIQYGDDFYMIYEVYSSETAAHEAFLYNFYNDVTYWEDNNLFDGNIRRFVSANMGYFTVDGSVGSGYGPSEIYYGVFYQYGQVTLMVLNSSDSFEMLDSFLYELNLSVS